VLGILQPREALATVACNAGEYLFLNQKCSFRMLVVETGYRWLVVLAVVGLLLIKIATDKNSNL